MIATDHNSIEIPGQFNYFVGIRAVANDITEIPNDVVLRRSSKRGFEGLKIAVDVRYHKCPHLKPSVVALLCLNTSMSAVIRHLELHLAHSSSEVHARDLPAKPMQSIRER
jgi:hypothetical protein